MTGSSEDSAGPTAEQQLGESDAPEVVGERLRRPASLRAAAESVTSGPRRRLTPPPFPKPDPVVSSQSTESVASTGIAGAAAGRIPAQIEKLVALVNERPEVGIGIAFAGGIVLATILKRLAR